MSEILSVGGSRKLSGSISNSISSSVSRTEKQKVSMNLKRNQCLWVEFVTYGKKEMWTLKSSNWKACDGKDLC